MRKTIVREIARFTEALDYQVELWDIHLVEYFMRYPDRFRAFTEAAEALSKHHIWFDSYRVSRGLAAPAGD